MDPLTHALLGGAAARVALRHPLGGSAWLPGAVGALLPDIDALARLSSDPLLHVEYHRHFTHALAFAPLGGAVAALPWLLGAGTRGRRLARYAAATIGYASHGLLDAATTYGTLLFWPFSHARVAWNLISIVDPLFTLLLIVGLTLALLRRSAAPAGAALLACAAYLTLGGIQRERAFQAQAQLAGERGEPRSRAAVFPGFANNVVWRSLYLTGDTLRMDRIRVPYFRRPSWNSVAKVALLREADLPAPALADAATLRDFRRFRWFSGGWVAAAEHEPELIGDARYSTRIDDYDPVWGIRLRPGERPAVQWADRSRQRRLDLSALWAEIRGD